MTARVSRCPDCRLLAVVGNKPCAYCFPDGVRKTRADKGRTKVMRGGTAFNVPAGRSPRPQQVPSNGKHDRASNPTVATDGKLNRNTRGSRANERGKISLSAGVGENPAHACLTRKEAMPHEVGPKKAIKSEATPVRAGATTSAPAPDGVSQLKFQF